MKQTKPVRNSKTTLNSQNRKSEKPPVSKNKNGKSYSKRNCQVAQSPSLVSTKPVDWKVKDPQTPNPMKSKNCSTIHSSGFGVKTLEDLRLISQIPQPSTPVTVTSAPSSPKRKLSVEDVENPSKRQCSPPNVVSAPSSPRHYSPPSQNSQDSEEDIEIDIVGEVPLVSRKTQENNSENSERSWSDADEEDMKQFGLIMNNNSPINEMSEQEEKEFSQLISLKQ